MFSRRTEKLFFIPFQVDEYLHYLPYKWNIAETRFICDSDIYRLLIRFFVLILVSIYTLNATWGFFSIAIFNTGSGNRLGAIVLNLMNALGYNATLFFHFNCWINGEEMTELMNKIIGWNKALIRKHNLPSAKWDGCEIFFTLVPVGCLIFLPFASALFLQDPTNPRYLYRHLPAQVQSIPTALLWLLVIEIPAPLLAFLVFALNTYAIVISTKCLNFWINYITVSLDSSDCMYSWDMLLNHFHAVQILTSISNSCFASFIHPTLISAITTLGIVGLVGAVKVLSPELSFTYLLFPATYLAAVMVQLLLYPMLGGLNFLSAKLIWKIRKCIPNRGTELKCRTLYPVAVTVSSIYKMRNTSVVSSLFFMVESTTNILLLW